MKKKYSIIVADDHPVIRKGLVEIISDDENFEVIAEAANGKDVLMLVKEMKPDIVVLDINMPGYSGFEVAKMLLDSNVNSRIVFLTMHKEEEILNKALDFEAFGYILKECAVDDIIDCLNFVKNGKKYISPVISDILLNRKKSNNFIMSNLAKLTKTEKRILSLISEEKTSKEISELLFISLRTVENHRINICHKLSLHGVNSLLKFAIDHKNLF